MMLICIEEYIPKKLLKYFSISHILEALALNFSTIRIKPLLDSAFKAINHRHSSKLSLTTNLQLHGMNKIEGYCLQSVTLEQGEEMSPRPCLIRVLHYKKIFREVHYAEFKMDSTQW
jgi:hypothetical protein